MQRATGSHVPFPLYVTESTVYRPNVCDPPKVHMLNVNLQSDGMRRQDVLKEVIRS